MTQHTHRTRPQWPHLAIFHAGLISLHIFTLLHIGSTLLPTFWLAADTTAAATVSFISNDTWLELNENDTQGRQAVQLCVARAMNVCLFVSLCASSSLCLHKLQGFCSYSLLILFSYAYSARVCPVVFVKASCYAPLFVPSRFYGVVIKPSIKSSMVQVATTA
jgi:hypothetical protein